MGAVPVDRQRRPDVVRVRLGDVAARGRVPDDLPRSRRQPAADADPDPPALAGVPGRVRRRNDQDARRSVLARPDLPQVPPRDAADAGPAELVVPPPAAGAAPHRGRRQSRRPARRAVPAVHAPAGRRYRRRGHHRHPAVADDQRQLLVAQRRDDHPRPPGARRRPARLAVARVGARHVVRRPGVARRPRRRRHRARRRAQLPAGAPTCCRRIR